MKNKHILKLFIFDYALLFIIMFVVQSLFFSILLFLKGIWIKEALYFSFLTAFVLFLYVMFRLYRSGQLYGKLLQKHSNLNDYMIHDPRSYMEKQFNALIDHLIEEQAHQSVKYKEDKQLQKVLVYRFVHQMKTPVSVLKLMLENHENDMLAQPINQNLDKIQYNLNQMLSMYQLDDFKNDFVSEKVYLQDICKTCINNLKDYFITAQVYPRLEISDDTYVYSDSKWLKLVLHQLLTNAIKYSYKGQSVIIQVHRDANGVTLSVIDEGMGIHEAELKRIFDIFYVGSNGRNNADSSGIGLYIARTVIDNLGHTITIESQLNQGTQAHVHF